MSFSFQSMFQGSAGPSQQDGAAAIEDPSTMISAPPLNAVPPFGNSLFKVASGEAQAAAPLQQSPFSTSPSAGTGSPLTVGDVLPLLPPEIARAGALPPQQPVAISIQVLDEALRGGQAAIPIFEIYRVCPALFQTPISPQDPRMIPLPASKLPHLIAATQQGGGQMHAAQPISASPFTMTPSNGSMTSEPHAMQSATPSGMLLPPRRQGPPPPLADLQNREAAPQLSLPGQMPMMAPAFPTTPFAAANGGFSAPPAESPFAASPFAASAPTAPAPVQAASPFSAMPAAALTPFGTAPSAPAESPFGTLFGSKAIPTGQQAPDVSQARPPAPVTLSAQPSSSSPQTRLPLSGLLKGYTMAELGFDPMVVPGWISTTVPIQILQQLASMPTPVVELGVLIDGITDVGFRNVLNTAKRDFQLRLAPEELQNALSAGAPPTLPNLASLGIPAAQTQAPAQSPFASPAGVMRVEAAPPQANFAASPFASATPPESGHVPGLNSPFLAPASALQQAAQPTPFSAQASAFSTAQPAIAATPFQTNAPAAPPSSPFGMPAAALQPPLPKAQDPFAAPVQPFASFQQPAPQQYQQPTPTFQAPDLQPAYAAQPVFTPPAFISPQPAPAEAAPTFFAQPSPMAETTVLPPEQPQEQPAARSAFSFIPPAPESNEGFSSDQLFGKQPANEPSWSAAAAAAASAPYESERPTERSRPAPVIDLPATPSSFFDPQPEYFPEPAPSFAATHQDEPTPRPKSISAASIKSPRPAAPRSAAPSPSLGVHMHDTDPDQILLRALLDTDTELTPQRVVEMACGLPGIAACVCIQGDQAISHVGAHKPQAREFQRQATDLAQHLRTLAPLIGIEGAETFTMNSGDRLMTFCFPEGAILGVLHDAEPTLGLRDKITLIARELSRMIA